MPGFHRFEIGIGILDFEIIPRKEAVESVKIVAFRNKNAPPRVFNLTKRENVEQTPLFPANQDDALS